MIDSTVKTIIQQVVMQRAHANGLVALERSTGIKRLSLASIAAGLPVRDGTLLKAAYALGVAVPPAVALSSVPQASDIGA
jgi:hypothetical protein